MPGSPAPWPAKAQQSRAVEIIMSGRKFRRKQAHAGSRGGDAADNEDAEEEPGSLALPPAAAAARRPDKVLVCIAFWQSQLAHGLNYFSVCASKQLFKWAPALPCSTYECCISTSEQTVV